MLRAMFYGIQVSYMRASVLSKKDTKILFEIDIKGGKNTVDMYSTPPFYELFLSVKAYLFKLAVNQ